MVGPYPYPMEIGRWWVISHSPHPKKFTSPTFPVSCFDPSSFCYWWWLIIHPLILFWSIYRTNSFHIGKNTLSWPNQEPKLDPWIWKIASFQTEILEKILTWPSGWWCNKIGLRTKTAPKTLQNSKNDQTYIPSQSNFSFLLTCLQYHSHDCFFLANFFLSHIASHSADPKRKVANSTFYAHIVGNPWPLPVDHRLLRSLRSAPLVPCDHCHCCDTLKGFWPFINTYGSSPSPYQRTFRDKKHKTIIIIAMIIIIPITNTFLSPFRLLLLSAPSSSS